MSLRVDLDVFWICVLAVAGCEGARFRACPDGASAGRACTAADAGIDATGDASQVDGDAGQLDGDAGQRDEAEGVDYADCTESCGPATDVDLFEQGTVVVRGILDDDVHTGGDPPMRMGDQDFFRVVAPPRTMVEVVARRQQATGLLSPALDTWDELRWITHADGDAEARTVFVYPYLEGRSIALWVVLADRRNVSFPGDSPQGGPRYGYELTFRASAFAPEELGTITSVTSPLEPAPGSLESAGEMDVYRFFVESASDHPEVDLMLSPLAPETAQPILVALTSVADQAVYSNTYRGDDESRTTEHIDWESLSRQTEYLFVVYDYNGIGQPDYVYELDLGLMPETR